MKENKEKAAQKPAQQTKKQEQKPVQKEEPKPAPKVQKSLEENPNAFDENENERYIYAICNPATEDYYSEVGRWERLFEYKSMFKIRKLR